MKKFCGHLALPALLFGLLAVPGRAQPAKTWAVVVGVDDYSHDNLPKLRYAVADAKLFAQVLQRSMGVPKENIRVLTSDALVEELQPRLTNVLQKIEELKAKVGPADTVIFYFAGHGLTVAGQSYLLTEDSDNRSPVTVRNSSIRSSEINQVFSELGSGNGWVVLDACRNSADSKSSAVMDADQVNSIVPEKLGKQRGSVVFSCNVGERSWEWDAKRHGFFTYYLTEGLLSASSDTQENLLKSVTEAVSSNSEKIFNHKQTPVYRLSTPAKDSGPWRLAYGGAPSEVLPGAAPRTSIGSMDRDTAQSDKNEAVLLGAKHRAQLELSQRHELEYRVDRVGANLPPIKENSLQNGLLVQRAQLQKKVVALGAPHEMAYLPPEEAARQPQSALASQKEQQRLEAENELLAAEIKIQQSRMDLSAQEAKPDVEVTRRRAQFDAIPSTQIGPERPLAQREVLKAEVQQLERTAASRSASTRSEVSQRIEHLLQLQQAASETLVARVQSDKTAQDYCTQQLSELADKAKSTSARLGQLEQMMSDMGARVETAGQMSASSETLAKLDRFQVAQREAKRQATERQTRFAQLCQKLEKPLGLKVGEVDLLQVTRLSFEPDGVGPKGSKGQP